MTAVDTMTRAALLVLAAALVGGCSTGGEAPGDGASPPASLSSPPGSAAVTLPAPRSDGPVSVEQALAARRSVREFAARSVTLSEVAQLVWAAQGVTEPGTGYRAAPSAGALYPLEVYVVAAGVEGLAAGVYRYGPGDHSLTRVRDTADTAALARAALSQEAVADAPAVLAIAAVFERTTVKYGERGRQYVHMEAGHAAQNVYLQAAALGLGTVAIGAFDDSAVSALLSLRDGARVATACGS